MTRCTARASRDFAPDDGDARKGFEAWLRHSLAEQYRHVEDDPLPAALLALLPHD